MIVITIPGPTFSEVQSQIAEAEKYADYIELRADLYEFVDFSRLVSSKPFILTNLTHRDQIHQINPAYIDSPQAVHNRIASYHNFSETPSDLYRILDTLPKASIYKIATMARSTLDSLRMLTFVRDVAKRGVPIIGICMGEDGLITRQLGGIYGSHFNYCCLDKAIAPGQIPIHRLIPVNLDTKVYGLIGDPVSFSQSHLTHNAYFQANHLNAIYVKMRLEADELPSFFRYAQDLGFKGLSVTMPLKLNINPPYPINTIRFTDHGLQSCNTDGEAVALLLQQQTTLINKTVAILGKGATAQAIFHAMMLRKANPILFGRGEYPIDYDILINATPVGMGTNEIPIEKHGILPNKIVLDVVSNPEETALILAARKKGCVTITGGQMFWQQALGQFDYWFAEPALHL